MSGFSSPSSSPGMLARPEEIPVFVLCGGLGTRLRKVDARPKAVIPIVRLPFLFYFLRLIGLQGFRNVHLLVGHGAEGVLTALGLGDGPSPLGDVERSILEPLTLHAHREETPQGTGGALQLARDSFGELNLIANADSYAEVVYPDLIDAHALLASRTREGITLLGVWHEERKDYGGLQLEDHPPNASPVSVPRSEEWRDGATDTPMDRARVGSSHWKSGVAASPLDPVVRMRTHRVTQFLEKGISGEGWINGGVYLAGRAALDRLPDGPSSLERELLPDLARESLLLAMTCRCFFRDIGTPERLKRAEQEFRWIRARF